MHPARSKLGRNSALASCFLSVSLESPCSLDDELRNVCSTTGPLIGATRSSY